MSLSIKKWIITDIDDDLQGQVQKDPFGLLALRANCARFLVPHLTQASSNIRLFQVPLWALYCMTRYCQENDLDTLNNRNTSFWPALNAIEEFILHFQFKWNKKFDDRSGLPGVRVAFRQRDQLDAVLGEGDTSIELLADRRRLGMFRDVSVPFRSMGLTDANDGLMPDKLDKINLLFQGLTSGRADDLYSYIIEKIVKPLFKGSKSIGFSFSRFPSKIGHLINSALLYPTKNAKIRKFWEPLLLRVPGTKDQVHQGAMAVKELLLRGETDSKKVVQSLLKHKDLIVRSAAERIWFGEALFSRLQVAFDLLAASRILKDFHDILQDNFLPAFNPVVNKYIHFAEKDIGPLRHDRAAWLLKLREVNSSDALAEFLVEQHKKEMERRGRQPWVTLESGKVISELDARTVAQGIDHVKNSGQWWGWSYYVNSMSAVLNADNEEADE